MNEFIYCSIEISLYNFSALKIPLLFKVGRAFAMNYDNDLVVRGIGIKTMKLSKLAF